MAKQMKFDYESHMAVAKGIEKLAAAVKVTMGPTGRNVILQKSFGSPRITKDGVTVSKEIELPDPFENMGAKMINEAASKTSDVAGDGTTTATVLAEAIHKEGLKMVIAGANPMLVKRGIDKAVDVVVDSIAQLSTKVKGDGIKAVATISANNDVATGELVAKAIDKVGAEGVITVEEGKSMATELNVVEGMQFDRGYLSPYFMTKGSSR